MRVRRCASGGARPAAGIGRPGVTIRVVELGVRQRTEELEGSSLSGWATRSAQSKGRERAEEPDPVRTAFQVDRDRVLYCAAFRQLRDKTHRFIPVRDPDAGLVFRSRLMHTLTTAQVARALARALRANEDLAEAIALGADLGATPYGDAAEEALAAMLDPPFRHDEQSLRVVELLEDAGRGLNLSWEVRDGILHHSWAMPPAATLEGQIVRVATRIAMLTHDLDAAVRAGVVSADDEVPDELRARLGRTAPERAAALVGDVVATSDSSPQVVFSEDLQGLLQRATTFLDGRITASPAVYGERDRAQHVVRSLVVFLMENPAALPHPRPGHADSTEQRVVDHLTSLGDGAISRLFAHTFMPGGPAGR